MIFGQMMEDSLTLSRLLERAVRMKGHRKISSRRPDGSWYQTNYIGYYQRVCKLAQVLCQMGTRQGDRVGVLAWNSIEYFDLYFAVPGIGAILHTLNLRLSSEELAYVINHAEDRILFVDFSLVPLLEQISHRLTSVEKYVIMGTRPDFKTVLSPVYDYEVLLKNEFNQDKWDEAQIHREPFVWPALDERQAAGLCYTSGTTGVPKGVLYSHRSQTLHAMTLAMSDTMGLGSSDVALLLVPMFHASGWGMPYAAIFVGAEILLPNHFYQPRDLAEMIQNFRVTVTGGVPTLWIGLLQHLRTTQYDLASLREIAIAGSAVPRSLIQAFEQDFQVPILHFWGMTELSPLGTCSGLRGELGSEERVRQKLKQGYAAPIIEFRVVASTSHATDDGPIHEVEQPWDGKSCGELQVRGPCVVSSYFKNRDDSIPHSSPNLLTQDGWFRTGDIAFIDPDGCMTIVDRTKDLIKSGGEWISSVALENAIMSLPQVQEAAVIGVPDGKWSERPLALVIPKPGSQLTAEDLKSQLAQSFAKFWIPDRIQFVAEIPKTSVGKIDKKKLRQLQRIDLNAIECGRERT